MAADTMNATTQSPDECAYIAAYQWYFIPPGSTPPPCPAVPNTFREHGLFVGEIIHHLAPGATIRLIRVLNDYGAGDIRTVIAALHAIPSMVGESRSVVVNLSLSVEPTVHCLLSFWRAQYPLPNIRTPPCDDKNPLIVNSSGSIVDATPLYVPFGLAVEDLATRPTDTAPRYTVVAAAGNDQDHDATMPGAFCGVKDVAAAQSLAQSASPIYSPASASLASFSNLPYVAPNQCLSVQPSPPSGANTNSQAAAQVQLKPIDPNDALIAIGTNICSLHPYFALGIADWQGTSFAAAFISGNIAANSGTLPSSLDQTMPCNPDRSG